MAQFPKGATVRQILPKPIIGTIERYEVDQSTGELQVLVTWPDTNGDGSPESRYFKTSEVELVDG
jgi:hypothetical protein